MNETQGQSAAPSREDAEILLSMSSEFFAVSHPNHGLVWSNHRGGSGTVPAIPDGLATAPAAVRTAAPGPDGTWRRLEWRSRVDTRSGLVCCAAHDVTDRDANQAALADNESRLQAILDHSSAAIFVKDLEGRYTLVNHAFVQQLGLESGDVLGRRACELWPDAAIEDEDDRVLVGGETFTRDDTVTTADGVHRVMTVRFPLRDAAGAITGMAAIATDITERTQVEAVLAERQRLLDTVIRACPDIVTVLDGSGRVREISQASRQILGYDLGDPVHDEVEALVHPDDLPEVYQEYARVLSMRDAQLDVRYRVRHADGRWVVLDTRGQAIVGEDGRSAGVVVVSRDVTEDLDMENQMRAAVEVAEQASRAKSEFLSRMSHELRTPLNSVLGFSQLLEMDDLPAHQGEAVGHIIQAGRHLLNLIDEVLDIARIESGNLELLLEPVPILDVVGDAVGLAGPLSEHAGIELALDRSSCPERAHVLADRQRLLQVLLNLLSNAVKYNHRGGRVDVSVEPTGEGVLRIIVSDTGNGISPADMGRVFEPFDRLGAERSDVEGTGVGLTLSKHLVDRMGGVIAVQSSVGRGTTFKVELPGAVAPPLRRLVRASKRDDPTSATSVRVLHIEDNLANLELVEQVLMRSHVVELYAAMTGSLGLELAREHRPDLILLDLHLPDLGGTELLDALHGDARTAAIPVAVITADATPAQVKAVRGSGVVAYLTKPIEIKELLRVVEMVAADRGGHG